ncbi:hypothetical protein [Streptomyces sp. NPDC001070]
MRNARPAARSGRGPFVPDTYRIRPAGPTRCRHCAQNTAGVPGSDETYDGFGVELHIDDVNGDGKADLTSTAIGENCGNGSVTALRSDGSKITTSGRRVAPSPVGLSTTGSPPFGADFTD